MKYTINSDGTVTDNETGKIRKGSPDPKGYNHIRLKINGKWITKRVSRLVAETHIPNPDNLTDVDHIDCNRSNDEVSNLRWLSHSDNIKYSYDTGNRDVSGERNANCKYPRSIVVGICELLQIGLSAAEIRDGGYPYGLVRAIKARRNWTSISEKYSF